MIEIAQHFEHAAGQLMLALDRLIGIGIGAHRQRFTAIGRRRQLLDQQLRCARLIEKPALEIKTRRQAEIGMGWSGKAVNTTMLATSEHIYRSIKWNIRRAISCDDSPSHILCYG
jgi:hypothetical protein